MRKVSLLLASVLLVSFVGAGCTTDSREIDDLVYVIAIGADKGVDNNVRITVQYPTYKGGDQGGMKKGGGGGQEEDKKEGIIGNTVVTTIEAPSILEGINLMNTFTSRKITLTHLKEVIFSEEFAREGIKSFLEPFARFRETRRNMQIGVCKGTAEDFIKKNKTVVGESLAKAMELMANQSDYTGYFPRAPFQNFYKSLLSPYGQAYSIYMGINNYDNLEPSDEATSPLKVEAGLLPGEIPRTGSAAREVVGTAVFDGDRMVGILDSYETRYFLLVNGEFKRGIFTLEDKNMPGDTIAFEVRLGRTPNIGVSFEKGIPVIDVDLNIEADIGVIQSRLPYEKIDRLEELNDMIKETMQRGIKETIEKTQKEFGSDIFNFGYQAAKNFFTIQEFEKYNWLKHYKEAKVNVTVEANVRRTGLMNESAPIRGSKKDELSEGE